MKINAIICEFNPLHNGHLYLINKVKSQSDILVAIMSGDFNQRGIPSCVESKIKASWALQAGFDIVVENPFKYVNQSGDFFANGAILVAKQLGVTDIYFGSENYTKQDFEKMSQIIIDNDSYIKQNINGKTNYPRVVSNLLKQNDFDLSAPNDLLGVSYMKAIMKYDPTISINPIKRLGGFHSLTPYNNNIASATFIRQNLNNVSAIKNYVPNYVYNDLKTQTILKFIDFEPLIIKNIYAHDKMWLKSKFGVDEGLENRILKMLPLGYNLDDLINLVKTKRYTYNRLQRMFLSIGLNVNKSDIDNSNNYLDLNILAQSKKGTAYLQSKNINSNTNMFESNIKSLYNKVKIAKQKGENNMSFVVEAQIEIQKNTKNKYETLDNGQIKLDRVLPSSQVYPTDYGFFNQTLGQDGDPLDVLLLSTESLLPGVLVDVRVVGVMFMVDGGEKDEKLIAVVDQDPRFDHVQSLKDVPEHTLKEVANYFSTYKQLQNKKTEVIGFEDANTAQEIYNDSVTRFNK